MKKYLVLIVFCISICSFAQIVTIPDANFKAKLLQANTTNFIAANSAGQSIKIDVNNDGNIQESEALLVTSLEISSSNISDLSGIESFSNLTHLRCSSNQIGSMDFLVNSNLLSLWCNNNQLTNLVIPQSLSSLYCYDNLLTSIDLPTNSQLISIRCQNNQLTSLDISGLPVQELHCYNNNISSLNLSNCTNLSVIRVENNQLTTLDISSSLQNASIFATDNPIVTVFLKNGSSESFSVTPTVLEFICADEENISFYEQAYPGVIISSYCSFTPGGNYNTITGRVIHDLNSDGCDINDQPKQNIRMNINDATNQNQGATFTNSEGNYNFYTNTGSFTLTPNIENPTWFTFSPANATIPFSNNNNNVAIQNFCLSANGSHPDVEIVIAPIVPARPGFNATYQVLIKNKGNLMLSGQFMLNYNDELLDFLDAGIFPNEIISGTLMWNFTDLQPFETLQTNVNFNVNAPTDVPPVNIGDELNFQALVTPTEGDEIPQDNVFAFNQTVVGSYDPNDITCIEGDVVPTSEIGEYLHYVINFENTGNSEAENIVVRTEIDATKFDVNSLQMLHTSHNAYIRQNGNLVEFIFQNIALESGGHGNVLLKIKTKDNLQNGDSVAKQANIYFDYNAPIQTNLANTTFQTLSSGDFEVDHSISVHPNPTASIINVICNSTIKSIQLYDIQGRLLQTQIVNETTASIDVSNQSNGIYFAKITSEVGVRVEKIIKE